jgi:hypothetical protein
MSQFSLWRLIEKSIAILNRIISKSGFQITYSVIKFKQEKQGAFFRKKYSPSDVALAIQGPLTNPKLIKESIDRYLENFGKVGIVVSTWNDDPALEKLVLPPQVQIILNVPPKSAGISNLNFQALSTVKSLLWAEANGFRFTLKMRTDQHLFSNVAIDRLLARYEYLNTGQYPRIVTTDFNSFLFRPYSPSDQLMFADTITLRKFWQSYDGEDETKQASDDFAEKILLKSYMKYLGIPFHNTITQSLEIYRDLYAFIDNEDLGLHWFKGTQRSLRSRFPQDQYPTFESFVRFADWLNIQMSLNSYLDAYQSLISQEV